MGLPTGTAPTRTTGQTSGTGTGGPPRRLPAPAPKSHKRLEVPGTADPAPEGLGSPDLRLPGEARQEEEAEGQAGMPLQAARRGGKTAARGSRTGSGPL